MRVVCQSASEFIDDLHVQVKGRGPDCVLQKTVRVSMSRRPIDSVRFAVTFQASAVVVLPDGGEYLLQCGMDCGIDYEDATEEMKGSDRAAAETKVLKLFCDASGLALGPGVIEP